MAKAKLKVKRESGNDQVFWGLFMIVFSMIIYMGYPLEIAGIVAGTLLMLKGILMKLK